MLISFIIPYHNEPIYMLRQCIENIIALSLQKNEREIILINDGSENSPMNYFDDYKTDIIYIYQKNQGLSCARNTGIERAKGDYIQFVDSDDYLFSDAYENIISSIRKKQIDMLMFRFSMNENYKKQSINKYSLSKCWKGDEFLCKNNIRAAACAYIFKKKLLGNLRFKKGILHEDSLFTPQLILKAEKLCVTNLKVYYYRQHQATIMSRRDNAHIKKRLDDIFKILLELQEKANIYKGNSQIALWRCINQQVMVYIYLIIILTKSIKEYSERTKELKLHGFYPLPLKTYTFKYWIFALLMRF